MSNIIRSWNGRTIRQREDGYLSATDMCQACGKLFADWFRLKTTSEYLGVASSIMGIPIMSKNTQANLIFSQVGGSIETTGTWLYRKIALRLAQWLSPEFAFQVDTWIEELLFNGYVKLDEVDTTPRYLPPLEQADKAMTVVERYKQHFGAMNPQMEQHFKDLVGNCLIDFMALTHRENQKELWMGVVNYAETELGYKVQKKGTHCDTTLGKWIRWHCPQLSDKQEKRYCNETQRQIYVYPIHLVGNELNKSKHEFFACSNPSEKLKSAGAYKRNK